MNKDSIKTVFLVLLLVATAVAVSANSSRIYRHTSPDFELPRARQESVNIEPETEHIYSWVDDLSAAKRADQLLIVAADSQTTAKVYLYDKDRSGNWLCLMETEGFIGKNGLGKEKTGDKKTPLGEFYFTSAFGIAEDPDCPLLYHKLTENDYWSGDENLPEIYNKMVDISDWPQLDKSQSEHLIDYDPQYTYCLSISYNEECVPGLGSAIFLHCTRPEMEYTGGCVAISQEDMRFVMTHVSPDCRVIIDSAEKLGIE